MFLAKLRQLLPLMPASVAFLLLLMYGCVMWDDDRQHREREKGKRGVQSDGRIKRGKLVEGLYEVVR